MKILLLGASGMLGHNVLLHLVACNHTVVAVVRSSSAELPENNNIEVRVIPTIDRKSLVQAASGCQAIVNCAGCTDMSLLRLADYLPANRDLCQTLLQVMMQCPVSTLVHVSTANTVWHGTATELGTEARAAVPPFSQALYVQSKQQGEDLLLQAAKGLADRHIVVLNPGFIIGSGGSRPSSGRLIDAAWHRPLMVAPRGGKGFVAATDVAAAVESALTKGRNGERYLIVNDTLSLRQFYALCATCGGYRQWLLTLPNAVVRLAGRIGDVLRSLGISTELCSANVAILIEQEHFSNAKACAELDLPHTPLEQAIRQYKKL